MSRSHRPPGCLILELFLFGMLAPPTVAGADPFAFQARANAAARAIVLGVQQGISALPPTAGQAFVYKLDTNTGLPVREELLGPVSLRTPATVEAHTLLLRAATSYFALDDSF